jgi:hypothetical protein
MSRNIFKEIMFVIVMIWAFIIIPLSYLVDKGGVVSGMLLVAGFFVILPLAGVAINKCSKEKV